MKSEPITLLFDAEQEKDFRARVLPLLEDYDCRLRPYLRGDSIEELAREATVICWVGDEALAEVLRGARERAWKLGILPHPDLVQARAGMQVPARLADAVADIFESRDGVVVDMLYCNERPVFNSVVIGDPFTLTPGKQAVERLGLRIRRFFRLVRSLSTTTLKPFRLITDKEKILDTAALGIVAVDRGDASPLTRRVVDKARADDRLLNALVLSPRSVVETIRFLLASIFLRTLGGGRLPEFMGHIKTAALTVISPRPVGYVIDGRSYSDSEIRLSIEPAALRLLSTRQPVASNGETRAEAKEVFRVQGLPTGQARTELITDPLPWIHHADTEEFKDLFLALRDNARTSEAYLTLMVLSTLLAVVGLFANSAPVIIGAMILAPLMAPIISLSMGVLRQHSQLTLDSARALAWGIGLSLLCGTLLTWLTPLQTINPQIEARLSPTLLDLGVAIISGVAGAYAHARTEVAKSLAGVAIAVALVPPLAVAGIGIGWMDWSVFWGAWLLFLTNLVGIVLAAAATFMFLGFSPFSRARRGLVISLVVVALISVPLALSFARMVDEHHVMRTLEGWQTENIRMRDVKVRPGDPLYISAKLISDMPVSTAQVDAFKHDLQIMLERDIVLEASIAVIR
ncbi:MAG: TIGR00341 family protein [Halothiobacillaceae bacterium]